ncbi:MAG TPA: hypothetical protein VLF94_02065, partial [Chlamydiales bacterium]|nr:hypothetical protein [Chlamydiales bacterium]
PDERANEYVDTAARVAVYSTLAQVGHSVYQRMAQPAAAAAPAAVAVAPAAVAQAAAAPLAVGVAAAGPVGEAAGRGSPEGEQPGARQATVAVGAQNDYSAWYAALANEPNPFE